MHGVAQYDDIYHWEDLSTVSESAAALFTLKYLC